MLKFFKWAFIAVVVLFVGMQLVPAGRSNPPIDPAMTFQAKVNVPPYIDRIVRRSCYDCHSHETVWPWYSFVAPVSWLVAGDVKNGRKLLNFSNWTYNTIRTVGRLDQMAQEVDNGDMPLKNYLLMHPNAKLSKADRDTIMSWVEIAREEVMNPPAKRDSLQKKK